MRNRRLITIFALCVGLGVTGLGLAAGGAARIVALSVIPLISLGFLIGVLLRQVHAATVLAELTTGLVASRCPAETRDLLADVLSDPAVELLYSPPGEPGWCDSDGLPTTAPGPARSARAVGASADSGLRILLICNRSFRDYPGLLAAVASCVVTSLERHRLELALTGSLADIAASRKRLAGAAYEARRRIERDLHDGAQQRLVALRVKLELAREAAEEGGVATDADGLEGLGLEVQEIIEEVRALAHGIYPPLLSSGGLGEALRAAGRRSPLPVTLAMDGVGRLPPEIENAVYFCCLEALQNSAKHAGGASRVTVALQDGDELRFEVSDDGSGFRPGPSGEATGITGMKDRVAAVGGALEIRSTPGAGTRVRGRIPRR